MVNYLQWVASALGPAGAFLLSLNAGQEFIAFVIMMVGSLNLMVYSGLTGQKGIFTMGLMYTAINIVGIIQHG